MEDREFPIQSERILSDKINTRVPATTIPWQIAEVVYVGYSDRYGTSQSLERLAERGGFGWGEVGLFYNKGQEILRKRYEDAVKKL